MDLQLFRPCTAGASQPQALLSAWCPLAASAAENQICEGLPYRNILQTTL